MTRPSTHSRNCSDAKQDRSCCQVVRRDHGSLIDYFHMREDWREQQEPICIDLRNQSSPSGVTDQSRHKIRCLGGRVLTLISETRFPAYWVQAVARRTPRKSFSSTIEAGQKTHKLLMPALKEGKVIPYIAAIHAFPCSQLSVREPHMAQRGTASKIIQSAVQEVAKCT
ncbi:uncharacterized protein MYCFIDRAFT_177922 [Pseudocercospora fijiensis CIRAD86]|uniref:Uncharacterized protein n=1 Tax=Pseudocercospora fijiensis (strain CIRAD86) TaxID=383855 RepID=M2YNL7_PSEFD|nr:uncharacterized protein MYCFIDRAFT_177922 [Pseudocercospora fijiensis CIRAD86]EME79300.1 hypothetical protein MYCFIDRAFT_177922 [Pseudocercospora fijiensis CIRAD86]